LEIPNLKDAVEQFLKHDNRWSLVPVSFEDYYFNEAINRVQYRNEKLHLKRKGVFGWIFYSIYLSPDMRCVWLADRSQSFRTMRFLNDNILEAYNADKKK